MTTVSFEECLENRYDETDNRYPEDFKFILQCNDLTVILIYSQEEINANQWKQLIDAVENGNEYTLTFLDSNGNLSITTKNKFTTFYVSKYGGYNSASSDIVVPSLACLGAFKQAYSTILRYNI